MTAELTQPELTAEILHDSFRASGPALRAFAAIADDWGLPPGRRMAILGLPSSTYYAYLKRAERARLSADTLERISYVLGIYKALNVLLPRAEARREWLRHPNSAPGFNGAAPLDVLSGGRVADLYRVRRYLDGERGW